MWRHFRRAILIVLMAMLINLGIAWLIAWRSSERMDFITRAYTQQYVAEGSHWDGSLEQGLFTLRFHVSYEKGTGSPNTYAGSNIDYFTKELPAAILSEMLEWCGSIGQPLPRSGTLNVTAHGWPAQSFYLTEDIVARSFARQPRDNYVVRGALSARAATFRQLTPILLPYLPMWRGLLLNMLLYVPLVWLTFANARMFRQWSRYRRGRCPRCGYDLRSDFANGCAECGWRRSNALTMPDSHGE